MLDDDDSEELEDSMPWVDKDDEDDREREDGLLSELEEEVDSVCELVLCPTVLELDEDDTEDELFDEDDDVSSSSSRRETAERPAVADKSADANTKVTVSEGSEMKYSYVPEVSTGSAVVPVTTVNDGLPDVCWNEKERR